jgi:hypothetical protein
LIFHGALKSFPGLRILKHDPHETLIGFLCSSNKRILQIKQMVACLADQLGEPIAGSYNQLPTWSVLARATDAQLKACALGYRAKFIRETARVLESQPHWIQEFEKLSNCGFDRTTKNIARCGTESGSLRSFIWIPSTGIIPSGYMDCSSFILSLRFRLHPD